MWRRFAEVPIVEQEKAVRMLIDPRLLHTRCRLFRRMVVVVVVAVMVAVEAVDGVKSCVSEHGHVAGHRFFIVTDVSVIIERLTAGFRSDTRSSNADDTLLY
jgi:hypothetical protein